MKIVDDPITFWFGSISIVMRTRVEEMYTRTVYHSDFQENYFFHSHYVKIIWFSVQMMLCSPKKCGWSYMLFNLNNANIAAWITEHVICLLSNIVWAEHE